MPLINSVINWLNYKRITQIDLYSRYPREIQEEVLFGLIDMARNTEFGRQYQFDTITSVAEFQKRVPLQTYEEIKPWVEKLETGGAESAMAG